MVRSPLFSLLMASSLAGVGAARSDAAPAAVIYGGLSDQPAQSVALSYPYAPRAPAAAVLAPSHVLSRFLGAGATFSVTINTSEIWLRQHPGATILNVPTDAASHALIVPSVTVTATKNGTATGATTLPAAQFTPSSFVPPLYCRRGACRGKLQRPGYYLKTTGTFVVPAFAAADTLRIGADSYGDASKALPSDQAVHVYAEDYPDLPNAYNSVFTALPFRIIERLTLSSALPTTFFYSTNRGENVVDGVSSTSPWTLNYPAIAAQYAATKVCADMTAGQVSDFYQMRRVTVDMKYRVDAGPWSDLVPLAAADGDTVLARDLFPQSGLIGEPETFLAGIVPAPLSTAAHVDVAFRINVAIDVDTMLSDLSLEDYNLWANCTLYPQNQGTQIAVGSVWDTPTQDATSGWTLPID